MHFLKCLTNCVFICTFLVISLSVDLESGVVTFERESNDPNGYQYDSNSFQANHNFYNLTANNFQISLRSLSLAISLHSFEVTPGNLTFCNQTENEQGHSFLIQCSKSVQRLAYLILPTIPGLTFENIDFGLSPSSNLQHQLNFPLKKTFQRLESGFSEDSSANEEQFGDSFILSKVEIRLNPLLKGLKPQAKDSFAQYNQTQSIGFSVVNSTLPESGLSADSSLTFTFLGEGSIRAHLSEGIEWVSVCLIATVENIPGLSLQFESLRLSEQNSIGSFEATLFVGVSSMKLGIDSTFTDQSTQNSSDFLRLQKFPTTDSLTTDTHARFYSYQKSASMDLSLTVLNVMHFLRCEGSELISTEITDISGTAEGLRSSILPEENSLGAQLSRRIFWTQKVEGAHEDIGGDQKLDYYSFRESQCVQECNLGTSNSTRLTIWGQEFSYCHRLQGGSGHSDCLLRNSGGRCSQCRAPHLTNQGKGFILKGHYSEGFLDSIDSEECLCQPGYFMNLKTKQCHIGISGNDQQDFKSSTVPIYDQQCEQPQLSIISQRLFHDPETDKVIISALITIEKGYSFSLRQRAACLQLQLHINGHAVPIEQFEWIDSVSLNFTVEFTKESPELSPPYEIFVRLHFSCPSENSKQSYFSVVKDSLPKNQEKETESIVFLLSQLHTNEISIQQPFDLNQEVTTLSALTNGLNSSSTALILVTPFIAGSVNIFSALQTSSFLYLINFFHLDSSTSTNSEKLKRSLRKLLLFRPRPLLELFTAAQKDSENTMMPQILVSASESELQLHFREKFDPSFREATPKYMEGSESLLTLSLNVCVMIVIQILLLELAIRCLSLQWLFYLGRLLASTQQPSQNDPPPEVMGHDAQISSSVQGEPSLNVQQSDPNYTIVREQQVQVRLPISKSANDDPQGKEHFTLENRVIQWLPAPHLKEDASLIDSLIFWSRTLQSKKWVFYCSFISIQAVGISWVFCLETAKPLNGSITLQSILQQSFVFVLLLLLILLPFLLMKNSSLSLLKMVQIIYKFHNYRLSDAEEDCKNKASNDSQSAQEKIMTDSAVQNQKKKPHYQKSEQFEQSFPMHTKERIFFYFCFTYYQNILLTVCTFLGETPLAQGLPFICFEVLKLHFMGRFLKNIEKIKSVCIIVLFSVLALWDFADSAISNLFDSDQASAIFNHYQSLVVSIVIMIVLIEVFKVLRTLVLSIIKLVKEKKIDKQGRENSGDRQLGKKREVQRKGVQQGFEEQENQSKSKDRREKTDSRHNRIKALKAQREQVRKDIEVIRSQLHRRKMERLDSEITNFFSGTWKTLTTQKQLSKSENNHQIQIN